MEVIPAIDILDGRCVRLQMGDFERSIDYSDPGSAAIWIETSGASRLHIVDLNAARGDGENRAAVAEIVQSTRLGVQVGGGIRDLRRVGELAEIGVARLVLGTRAVEQPEFIRDVIAETELEVAVSLDYRLENGIAMVQVRGWVEQSGVSLRDALLVSEDMGAGYVLATDIGRDGMLSGPDLQTYSSLLDQTDMELIASGGVSSIFDLEELSELESPLRARVVHSVVVGRAIHDRRVVLSEVVNRWK